MGYVTVYTELFFPSLLLHALSLLAFVRKIISMLFRFLGLPDFLEPNISRPNGAISHHALEFDSVSTIPMHEILPVMHFSELVDPSDSCAICLYEFEGSDEIRRLTNCQHIFHRSCLDRWMCYAQKTCPVCRRPLIPHDMQEALDERWWAASGFPEFFGDHSAISGVQRDNLEFTS